ncbi:BTB/POZ domain-containing protein At1g21780 isoform X2 [Abrus precatorius]|uniref:BTB/POZ domain-containing protein At1g21780 isoform X2 n=1 Tax=Abrus precatorius TaxID=3816 RepID=A0A8B8K4J2_ABRPR|nr:BTB/POZ domain-containing protein At1g21780 isoform X2 [Abrus precatorius]
MGDRVETLARLAQWKIDSFGSSSYKKSEPFKVGIWNWYFSIVRNSHRYLYIHLFPEPSRVSKDHPPLARFILRVSNAGSSRSFRISPVQERVLRTHDDFVWPVDTTFVGRFIIDVEFLDLKICPLNGEASSILPSEGNFQSIASRNNGTLKAHKAVLSASSPVFQSMFHHNLKEKESSTIHIEDMSLESCMALLTYLYGTIKQEDFLKHRLALLGAANKYDIGGLKDFCEESLLEDLNSGNVLEMLNEAWFYQLHKLKKGCLTYLFEFGKIYDIKEDEQSNFFQHADRELMVEMFHEVLSISNPV